MRHLPHTSVKDPKRDNLHIAASVSERNRADFNPSERAGAPTVMVLAAPNSLTEPEKIIDITNGVIPHIQHPDAKQEREEHVSHDVPLRLYIPIIFIYAREMNYRLID